MSLALWMDAHIARARHASESSISRSMVLFLLDDPERPKEPTTPIASQFTPRAEMPRTKSAPQMRAHHRRHSSKKGLHRSHSAAVSKLPPIRPDQRAPTSPRIDVRRDVSPRTQPISRVKNSSYLPQRAPPGKMLKQRELTGIGAAPSYSRAEPKPTHVATQPALDGLEKKTDAEIRLMRRQRAAQQHSMRAQRSQRIRGAHLRPALRSELPDWRVSWPDTTTRAADNFDRSHRQHWDQGEALYLALAHDGTHIAKQEAFQQAMMEMFMNRYKEPSQLQGVPRFARRQKVIKRKPWKLETSIWGVLHLGTSAASQPVCARARAPISHPCSRLRHPCAASSQHRG